jgi:hypothetical protein
VRVDKRQSKGKSRQHARPQRRPRLLASILGTCLGHMLVCRRLPTLMVPQAACALGHHNPSTGRLGTLAGLPRSLGSRVVLQMRQAATNLTSWITSFSLESPSEHFVSLATPPHGPQIEGANECGVAALRHAPHQHTVRQILVACTNRRILVLHTPDTSRILLSCTLPACITHACSLSVGFWPHTPAGRSDSSSLSPVKGVDPMSVSPSRSPATDCSPPPSSHASHPPDGAHICSAPTCLGLVFVSCRARGLTAVLPLALVPAAHGLVVNVSACDDLGAAATLSSRDPHSCTPDKAMSSQAGLTTLPRTGIVVIDAVPSWPSLQPEAGTGDAGAGPVQNDGCCYPASEERLGLSGVPWQLSCSVAATWLGEAQVVGHPLAALAVDSPVAMWQYARAEASTEEGVHSVLETIRDCIDNVGVTVLIPDVMPPVPSPNSKPAVASQVCSCFVHLEAWAHGHDGGCFSALANCASELYIVRAGFHGSPVLQRYCWAERQDAESARASGWRDVCICGAARALEQQQDVRTSDSGSMQVTRDGDQKLRSWSSPVATCSGQLQQFCSCWSGQEITPASAWRYPGCDNSPDLPNLHSHGRPTCVWAAQCARGSDCVVIGWPFDDAMLPGVYAADVPALMRAAVHVVLERLQSATTVGDVWVAAMTLGVAQRARHATLQPEHGIEGDAVQFSTLRKPCQAPNSCAACHAGSAALHARARAPAGRDDTDRDVSTTVSHLYERGALGALEHALPCCATPGRVVAGAVNAWNGKPASVAPAFLEKAQALLACWDTQPQHQGADDAGQRVERRAGAEPAVVSQTEALGCVVAVLRSLAPPAQLHLQRIRVPSWACMPELTGSGAVCRTLCSSIGGLEQAGVALPKHGEAAARVFEWLVVPGAAAGGNVGGGRASSKGGRYQVIVGDDLISKMSAEVKGKLSNLSDAWNKDGRPS